MLKRLEFASDGKQRRKRSNGESDKGFSCNEGRNLRSAKRLQVLPRRSMRLFSKVCIFFSCHFLGASKYKVGVLIDFFFPHFDLVSKVNICFSDHLLCLLNSSLLYGSVKYLLCESVLNLGQSTS